MSESEIPNSSPDPIETPETKAQPTDSGWTTMNFPNAIEVDSVPPVSSEPEPSQFGWRVQGLEQQNQKLRSRVAELEFALGEAHATLRADTKRLETQLSTQQAEAEQRSLKESQLAQQQTVMIAKQRQALDASRQRLRDQETHLAEQTEAIKAVQGEVSQLHQSLEQAHQIQQKQQILIDTLTAQLESSQSRVAQLERDCALTKQQYDEQIQQLRHAESNCRDLRSRLNRQQQYTLQFKAALEKCLDVSATQKIEESVDEAISRGECSTEPVEFIRAQPVQPWSTTLDSISAWNDSEPAAFAWANAPSEDSLFVEADPELESIAQEPLEEAPFELDYSRIELPEPIMANPPLSYTIKRSTEEVTPVQNTLDLFVPDEVQSGAENFTSENFVSEPTLAVEVTPEEIEAVTQEEVTVDEPLALPPVEEPVIASVPSPFITLTESDRIRNDEPVEFEPMGESPSPVVYPQRSQKKRESLAAVELPTFPKK